MKKKILHIFALSVLIIATLTPAVRALSEAEEPSTTSSTTTSTDSSSSTTNTSAAQRDKAARESRLETYKKALKETLSETTKLRIAEKCIGAQTILKAKTSRNETATSNRTTKYDEITQKLESLSTNVKQKGMDVTVLNANIADLKTKITSFKTANTIYQQNLTDLGLLDCKADPIAFKAALETARTSQKSVLTSAKEIRSFLTTTVKETLVTLKKTLDSEE